VEARLQVQVKVGSTNIARTARGAVVGPIWIAASDPGVAFPEVDWSDFPVILLGIWIPALRRLSSHGRAAECHFMDGPYRFTVSTADAATWRVACFETRETPSVANAVAEWFTGSAALLESAVSAGKTMLGYCDARGWWNDDTDRLREALGFTDPDRAS
jgi:hypothetical protein